MASNFLPVLKSNTIKIILQSGNFFELFDFFTQPLHEGLYNYKSFDFLDQLSNGQQLLLVYDYIRMQVGQGGFIQYIHNGYISLLPSAIEQLSLIGATDMAKLLDDVLKIFVLNKEYFYNAITLNQFAELYNELKEFETIDDRFNQLNNSTIKAIMDYALNHIHDFAKLID